MRLVKGGKVSVPGRTGDVEFEVAAVLFNDINTNHVTGEQEVRLELVLKRTIPRQGHPRNLRRRTRKFVRSATAKFVRSQIRVTRPPSRYDPFKGGS